MPIPVMDYVPETIEEEIISYADLFFGKSGDLWEERSVESAREKIAKFGEDHDKIFVSWMNKFE